MSIATLRMKNENRVKKKSAIIMRYSTLDEVSTIAKSTPIDMTLENATIRNFPNSRMVVCRTMILYVRNAHMKYLEKNIPICPDIPRSLIIT